MCNTRTCGSAVTLYNTILSELQSLTLRLDGCSQLANVDGLRGLGGLAALQSLTLNLNDCEQLANVDGLQGLGGLAALESLTLDLKYCRRLSENLQRSFDRKDEFLMALSKSIEFCRSPSGSLSEASASSTSS